MLYVSMFDSECLHASEQGFSLSNGLNNMGQLFWSSPSWQVAPGLVTLVHSVMLGERCQLEPPR